MKRTDLRLQYQKETGKEFHVSAIPTTDYCIWLEDKFTRRRRGSMNTQEFTEKYYNNLEPFTLEEFECDLDAVIHAQFEGECEWIKDTDLGGMGYPGCVSNQKIQIIKVGYKYCPFCGRKIKRTPAGGGA
jgi:hypothetical protein